MSVIIVDQPVKVIFARPTILESADCQILMSITKVSEPNICTTKISESNNSTRGYLELLPDPIRFEPVSKVTNVFFDEANKEVLSVRGGGTLGVVVKGEKKTLTFCIDHKGTISSIKFSPDHSVLAIQRNDTAVELLNYNNGEPTPFVTQECRAKGATLLGFIWSDQDDLVLVNDHAVEFYQILREKLSLRFVKSYSQNAKWFVFSPQCFILLLCTAMAPTSATLQPFAFSTSQITKYSKFEVEMSGSCGSGQPGIASSTVVLGERDVCIGSLYNTCSVLVLRHPASPTLPAHLDVYTQAKDGSFKKSHICILELTGKFAVNILDSLIIVHHQASKTSLMFDILLGMEVCHGVTSVYPVTMPSSIQPFSLEEPVAVPSPSSVPRSIPCQLYSPTWVVFQPHIIIDARLGCMWKLNLCLDALPALVEDKAQLIDCLLRRQNAKSLVFSVVKEEIDNCRVASLGVIFDKINTCYRQHMNFVLQAQMGECVSGGSNVCPTECVRGSVVVDQAEIYSAVFAPLMDDIDVRKEKQGVQEEGKMTSYLMVGVVLEYIRSLGSCGISVQHFINELVINGLVRTNQFYQLHQLLQYHVLSDSKPLACLLLSLVGVYAAGEQLSLDMLSRLNTAHDEILEVLLSHKMVVQALRYAKSIGQSESISARKFLEVAMTTSDPLIFYSTFRFFTQRNMTLRGNSAFAKGEHCEEYVKHFQLLFGDASFDP